MYGPSADSTDFLHRLAPCDAAGAALSVECGVEIH